MKIPKGQNCLAFDPMMILPGKTADIIDSLKANTSCVAPAYVYLEGSRGKRFLCDYHYHYEKDMTTFRTPEQWQDIARVVIDERESIKETFPAIVGDELSETFDLCWCGFPSLIRLTRIDNNKQQFFCNFHYRKTFFRFLSNGQDLINNRHVLDERASLKLSIAEEAERLTQI